MGFDDIGELRREVIVDLMIAYDTYLFVACEARLFDKGWCPVGICEFYENEYQNVWDESLGAASFDYMYDERGV